MPRWAGPAASSARAFLTIGWKGAGLRPSNHRLIYSASLTTAADDASWSVRRKSPPAHDVCSVSAGGLWAVLADAELLPDAACALASACAPEFIRFGARFETLICKLHTALFRRMRVLRAQLQLQPRAHAQ
jgi:hypothetical protein